MEEAKILYNYLSSIICLTLTLAQCCFEWTYLGIPTTKYPYFGRILVQIQQSKQTSICVLINFEIL